MKWQPAFFVLGALATQVLAGSDTIDCDIDESAVLGSSFKEQYDYLNGLGGYPTAEGGKCNRVSCSYNLGIYVCSNDGKDHPLKSWDTVADVSKKIYDECVDGYGYVKGRLYSSDGWGAIIQGASC